MTSSSSFMTRLAGCWFAAILKRGTGHAGIPSMMLTQPSKCHPWAYAFSRICLGATANHPRFLC